MGYCACRDEGQKQYLPCDGREKLTRCWDHGGDGMRKSQCGSFRANRHAETMWHSQEARGKASTSGGKAGP